MALKPFYSSVTPGEVDAFLARKAYAVFLANSLNLAFKW